MQVVEVLDGGWYRLGCSQGILATHYQAADLETVEAEYSELEDIPEMTILLTASGNWGQSINNESNSCNCRTDCSTRRCPVEGPITLVALTATIQTTIVLIIDILITVYLTSIVISFVIIYC